MGQERPPRTELGRLIRARRTEMGWSQRDLAEMTGIRQPSISAFERGTARPSPEQQEKLAVTLMFNPIAGLIAWLEADLPAGYRIVKEDTHEPELS